MRSRERRGARWVPGVLVLWTLVALVAGCGSDSDDAAGTTTSPGETTTSQADETPTSETTEATATTDGTEVATAQVGECISNDVTALIVAKEALAVVDCTDEHTAEIFHTFDLPDGDLPANPEISAEVKEVCSGATNTSRSRIFEDYVGISYENSDLEVSAFAPTADGWTQDGDREVVCVGTNLDGTPLTESIRGSNR